jgi:flagellar basal-body rod modification protein FlgD
MPTIDPVFHPMPTEASTPAVPVATPRSNDLDRDTFLKLMIAQLKNQDPSSPVDSKDFLVQTAQFSVVEKLEQMAKLNTELLAATRLGSASALVGRSVTYLQPSANPDVAPVERSGAVSGVRVTADGLVLKVAEAEVALSSVIGVGPAPTTAPTAAQ